MIIAEPSMITSSSVVGKIEFFQLEAKFHEPLPIKVTASKSILTGLKGSPNVASTSYSNEVKSA